MSECVCVCASARVLSLSIYNIIKALLNVSSLSVVTLSTNAVGHGSHDVFPNLATLTYLVYVR